MQEQSAVIIQVHLLGGDFGQPGEVRDILEFEAELIRECQATDVAGFEGNEFGGGIYEARVIGDYPSAIADVAVATLTASGLVDRAEILLEDVQTGSRISLWSGKNPRQAH